MNKKPQGTLTPIDFESIVKEKLVFLSLGIEQVSSNVRYYFTPDKELSNALITGVKVMNANVDFPLLEQPQNPATSPLYLVAAELRLCALTMINKEGDHQWDMHPLFPLTRACTLGKKYFTHVKPIFDRCFVTVFQPIVSTGQVRKIPFVFYYKQLKNG